MVGQLQRRCCCANAHSQLFSFPNRRLDWSQTLHVSTSHLRTERRLDDTAQTSSSPQFAVWEAVPGAPATMLAAHHDQENIIARQAGASKQQLQAKTPAARFPKTPLKVPLNDENADHGFGGKSILRTKGNNENAITAGKAGGNAQGKSGKQPMVTPVGASCPCAVWLRAPIAPFP